MVILSVFLNVLHSYCEIIILMCVSVLEPEVPKEKEKPAPIKKGTDVEIVIENYLFVHLFFVIVNKVDP